MNTINFRGHMWSCLPRIVWQKLFDFYREQGGRLDYMDNMLIDHTNCIKLFEDDLIKPVEVVKFIWGCSKNRYDTTWTMKDSWVFDDPERTAKYSSGHDFHVVVEVSSEQAIFTVIEQGEE